MSIILSNSSRLKPNLRLAQAISQFEADLSSEQKVIFRNYRSQSQNSPPDPSDVMRLTAEVDCRSASNKIRRGRCFGPRMTNFLQAVQQFATVADVVVGGSQNIVACGIWSLVRMSLLLIVNFSSYLEKLSVLLMTAGHSAPRYQMIASLYPRSKNLQSYLLEYLIVVVNLCHRVLKFTQKSTLGQLASSLSDSDTKSYQSEFDQWANAIKEEMNLLMAKTIEEEAQDNSKFRALSSKFSTSLSLRQKLKTKSRILDSCSTYDYQTTWKQTRKIGNTTLFNRSEEYKDWKGQKTSCTLIYTGGLGSGKSVLLANLIDDLHLDSRNKNITVAYFFCRHDIPESLKARTVIGSLARQLLHPIADLTMVSGFIDDKTSTFSLGFQSIANILHRVRPPEPRAYFILDGLDECDSAERELLISQLQELQETFSLVVCVSVRLDPGNVLSLSPERFIAAQVTSIPNDNPDIGEFILAELESHIESKRLVVGNPLLILEIQDSLLKGSQGMFLWVALQIVSLCDMNTDEAIRHALTELPKDLSETFSRILRKSGGYGKTYQRRILELVTIAHRPLAAEELRDALSVVPGDTVWDWSRRLNDVNLISTCCGSLLTIDEEERTIRLVHHSVKQFLLSGFEDSVNVAFTIDGANRTMAKIIITYLNYGVFTTQLSTTVAPKLITTSAPSQIIRSTPELSSSAQSLALKLLKYRKQPNFDIGKTLTETSKLFSSRSMDEFHFYSYAKLYWIQHIFCISEQEPVIYELLCRLLKGNIIDINATDGDGYTPLSLAARDGNEAILKPLLDSNNIIVDLKDKNGRTPFSLAAENGQEAIIKALLNFDIVDTDSEDISGRTPLSRASGNGHEAVVGVLIDKGADLESVCSFGRTPTSWAAEAGHEAVLKLLLDKGAKLELEAYRSRSETPLVLAAGNGHEVLVKLLLDRGANPEFEYFSGKTALMCAAGAGQEGVVKLLLDRGVNIEPESFGRTPLTWAVEKGHEAVARQLISKGANLESISYSGRTPLALASGSGYEVLVKLLLSKGANLESECNTGQTPLSEAAEGGHEAVVKLLLNEGAKIGAKDSSGRTPLSWAAGNGHEAAVKLLLKENANTESGCDNGRTPLSWAAEKGHEAVVKLLLDKGARPESKDIDGQTPLIWATRNGNRAVVTLLSSISSITRQKVNRDRNSEVHWISS